ncbi:hypothetical protein GIB67_020579 [Kingdonia uniflora]|uniref:hAT-like transposase RNase-H fold domain-containing protein n=1 Tax=Kingdonia uniflora TaxID=39325 RepID=A0A7J7NVM3_9MAGN|nr:hypothetical protein GIB67_020579 [Kingdonia uniflora]
MILGNLIAITQISMKRMLTYLSIETFACIVSFGLRIGTDNIRDYVGLYTKDLFLALSLALCLLSLGAIGSSSMANEDINMQEVQDWLEMEKQKENEDELESLELTSNKKRKTILEVLSDREDSGLKSMGLNMVEKYDKYWDLEKLNLLLLVGVVLDPRLKLDYIEFGLTGLYDKGKVDLIYDKMGSQADEVFSEAWHSDTAGVSGDGVASIRSKVYLSHKLSYLRANVIEAQDLHLSESHERGRFPKVYV